MYATKEVEIYIYIYIYISSILYNVYNNNNNLNMIPAKSSLTLSQLPSKSSVIALLFRQDSINICDYIIYIRHISETFDLILFLFYLFKKFTSLQAFDHVTYYIYNKPFSHSRTSWFEPEAEIFLD